MIARALLFAVGIALLAIMVVESAASGALCVIGR